MALDRHAGVLSALLLRQDAVRGAVRVVVLDASAEGEAMAEVLRGLGFVATEVLPPGEDAALTLRMACEPDSVDVLVAEDLPGSMIAQVADVLLPGGMACIHAGTWTRQAIEAAGLLVERHEARAGSDAWFVRKA